MAGRNVTIPAEIKRIVAITASLYCAVAGFGTITLCDYDTIIHS